MHVGFAWLLHSNACCCLVVCGLILQCALNPWTAKQRGVRSLMVKWVHVARKADIQPNMATALLNAHVVDASPPHCM